MIRLSTQLFNKALYARIRQVWFAGVPSDATTAPVEANARWFGLGGPEEKARFDGECRAGFGEVLDAIAPEKFELPPAGRWAAERADDAAVAAPFFADDVLPKSREDGAAKDAMSLIILLDQIPRNIFRENQAIIYNHYDRISRAVLYTLLQQTPRVDLHPSVRTSSAFRLWFYLPLMHSEHLEDHARFLELMEAFKADVKDDAACSSTLERDMEFGKKHADIIKRFGRYPYRNDHLGRETTKEEREYLEGGGETFGTRKE